MNFFLLDLFAFPKYFFCPWALTVLYFIRKRFSQNPRIEEVHFKAFQWACETRVSLEYFLVEVRLFVAHFLVYVSLNGAYLGMVLQRSCPPAQVKCQS